MLLFLLSLLLILLLLSAIDDHGGLVVVRLSVDCNMSCNQSFVKNLAGQVMRVGDE